VGRKTLAEIAGVQNRKPVDRGSAFWRLFGEEIIWLGRDYYGSRCRSSPVLMPHATCIYDKGSSVDGLNGFAD